MTEREKCARGAWYDANNDPDLLAERDRTDDLCFEFNMTKPSAHAEREAIMRKILPHMGENVTILSPFYTDYGRNCYIGDNTFLNHNAYLMDPAPIKIGKFVFIGPNCGMYTALHPLTIEERNRGLEKAMPITIGDNVWICSNVSILAGVTIGEGAVIGAQSVVTKDIPAHTLAMGNPCRPVREITDRDSILDEIAQQEAIFAEEGQQ